MDWSLGVEAFIHVCVTTSVVWLLLFDRRANEMVPDAPTHSSTADRT